jgi:sialate O-acetylesterase
MRSLLRLVPVFVVVGALSSAPVRADVKPHSLFVDGAVLQRGQTVPVWGTADPTESVEVGLFRDDKEIAAAKPGVADKDGHWRCDLPALNDAGGPYELRIKGKSNSVTVKDVLVGEVWVCSGQSNMEWPLSRSKGAKAAIKGSADPKIRLFRVTNGPSLTPEYEAKGQWVECNPKAVENFSAVGYYFGRYLRHKLDVPVGLIQNAWGGTPAEVWTSRKVLESDPALKHLVENFEQRVKDYPKQLEGYANAAEQYIDAIEKGKNDGKAGQKPKKPGDPKTFVYSAPFLLYNARIATIIPYAIRGAIWYQGESNAGPVRAEEYATLFPAMIKNWRHDWGQGDFPFLFVQLAPFQDIDADATDTPWAWLREAQRQTSLTVPNTAMAVITDLGDEQDIHPKDKRPVGQRLAFAALDLAYGQKVPYTGPVYDSMKVENGKAVVSFKNADSGLEARAGELTGFTIAGKDGKFVPAMAVLQGNQVVVSSPEITEPAAVRFGWANYPVVNLWGKDGLPASPFRTDNFPPPWRKPAESAGN